jgi:TPR repeat protein
VGAARARASLEAAAEYGKPSAMLRLARLLIREDPARAEQLCRRAAELGDIQAAHNVGRLLAEKGELHESCQWFRRAVELGSDRSMIDLGLIIRASDPQEATDLFRKAADAGSVEGMHMLGWTLMDNDDNKAEAERWLSLADQQGTPHNRNHLAVLLRDTDRERSRYLLQKSAERGETCGMRKLISLADEEGDKDTARYWTERAGASGDTYAKPG